MKKYESILKMMLTTSHGTKGVKIYKVKDGFPVWPARLSLIKLIKIKWWDVLTNIRL